MLTVQSYWDILPNELQRLIIEHRTAIIEYRAALTIQQSAVKMFYKRYGKNWKEEILNYENNLNYFCYLNGINDPWQDYIEYYR